MTAHMSDWLSAFDGIEHVPGSTRLLTATLKRRRVLSRPEHERVLVSIGALRDIAQRINSLSEALVEAQGGLAAGLGPQDLAEYERAQQEAAERAAMKRGVLAEDGEGDWAALYDHTGRAIERGHVSSVRNLTLHEGWSVVILDCEGVLDGDTGEDFPDTLDALKALVIRRKQTTDELREAIENE